MARSRRKFARNHQSSWLYGRHAVRAMLEGSHWRAEEVLAAEPETVEPVAGDVPVVPTDPARIAELVKTDDHQGLAARMPPYPYAAASDLCGVERVLILDRVQYPMNFGTMIRSAEVFGVGDVLIGSVGQCEVTASVARMSVGAVFRCRVARCERLADGVRTLREDGIRVLAATLAESTPCHELDLTGRCGIVIGRESDGVSPDVLAECGGRVLIPQAGQTQSLNAAASAAVLLYEMSRQRAAG